MLTVRVTICEGTIAATEDVTVTVGGVPPEWQPLQPSDAMPFLRASARTDTSAITRPATSPNRRLKLKHTMEEGRPATRNGSSIDGISVDPQAPRDLVGEQKARGQQAQARVIDGQPPCVH